MSPQAMQAWAARYRLAAIELLAQKRRELRALTDVEAARRADAVIEAARASWIDPRRQTTSGLVEQQRVFQRLRPVPSVLG